MQQTTAKVDRQATSLLDMSFWSNLAVMVLLLVVNAVNLLRVDAGAEPLIAMASPEMVMIFSLALCVWLAYGCYGVLSTRRRLSRVYVTCSESGVEGVSLPNPVVRDAGEPFSLAYAQIKFVGVAEAPLTKKQNVPSLKLGDGQKSYLVPAPEGLEQLIRLIAERMTAD